MACKVTVRLGKINGKACRCCIVYIGEIRGSNLDPETRSNDWSSHSFRQSNLSLPEQYLKLFHYRIICNRLLAIKYRIIWRYTSVIWTSGVQSVQKSKSQLSVLGVRRVTGNMLHNESSQTFGATFRDLFIYWTWRLGFVHPCFALLTAPLNKCQMREENCVVILTLLFVTCVCYTAHLIRPWHGHRLYGYWPVREISFFRDDFVPDYSFLFVYSSGSRIFSEVKVVLI